MQTLGLSDSTPRTESRLKSLFWPSIQTAADVDYLGTQGYWVCTAVAVLSLVLMCAGGQPFFASITALFFYLGGVGVRERSRFAATIVLALYVAELPFAMFYALASPGGAVLRVIITALLVSNFRATWIAYRWKPDSAEATPEPRLADTWSDKFADRLPAWLWPKVRVLYYIFSSCWFALSVVGLLITLVRRVR
jgi:hypothetical protein